MNQKVKAAKKFLARVKAKDPVLYQTLIDNAEFFLLKDKNDYSASDLRTAFKSILNKEPELNPVENPDTYGIKLAIDAVAGDNERESAASAKRLFGSTLDQVFKEELFLTEEEWRQGGVRFFQMGDTLNPALKNAPAKRKKPMKHKSRT